MNEEEILNECIPGIKKELEEWPGNSIFIGEWSIATTENAPFSTLEKF